MGETCILSVRSCPDIWCCHTSSANRKTPEAWCPWMMRASSGLRFFECPWHAGKAMRHKATQLHNSSISFPAWGEVKGYLDGTEGRVGGRPDYNLKTFRTEEKGTPCFHRMCRDFSTRGICKSCELAKANIWCCCFATSSVLNDMDSSFQRGASKWFSKLVGESKWFLQFPFVP